MNTASSSSRWSFPISVLCLVLYMALLAWLQLHHEPWSDEIHSWNLAKECVGLGDLFHNIRYEGHPPLWYFLLWLLSKGTHSPQALQLLQYAFACLGIVLILFRSPFPVLAKALLPFGYFLFYEYGCLSRNYALAVCLAAAALILIREGKAGNRWYYLFLFLLASTHLFGIFLAISMHIYVISAYSKEVSIKIKWLHILLGAICVLPILLFIIPPSDSALTLAFWSQRWDRKVLAITASAPLRSFFPLPVWWQPNFWNSHFLLQLAQRSAIVKVFGYVTSLGLVLLASLVLKDDRRALRLFLVNTVLIAAHGTWFPLIGTRYAGFLFLGFLAALWLHKGVSKFNWKRNFLFYAMLFLQIPGTVVAFYWDGKKPFSNAFLIKNLGERVPANSALLSDFPALDPLITYYDRPFYCLEVKREIRFVFWTNEINQLAATPDPYRQGAEYYFKRNAIDRFYLISGLSPQLLRERDSAFENTYSPLPLDSLTGAIQNQSSYYLYEVARRH